MERSIWLRFWGNTVILLRFSYLFCSWHELLCLVSPPFPFPDVFNVLCFNYFLIYFSVSVIFFFHWNCLLHLLYFHPGLVIIVLCSHLLLQHVCTPVCQVSSQFWSTVDLVFVVLTILFHRLGKSLGTSVKRMQIIIWRIILDHSAHKATFAIKLEE